MPSAWVRSGFRYKSRSPTSTSGERWTQQGRGLPFLPCCAAEQVSAATGAALQAIPWQYRRTPAAVVVTLPLPLSAEPCPYLDQAVLKPSRSR